MVIDSSALIAILFDESDRLRIEQAIEADPVRLVSAMTKLETSIVLLGRRGETLLSRLDRLLHRMTAVIVPFDDHQAESLAMRSLVSARAVTAPASTSAIAPPMRCAS